MSTTKTQTKDYQYVKGFNTNLSNDDMPLDQWRYITDAREVQIGKWETRLGTDLFSIPIGEAVNVSQTSTTGASTFAFNMTTRFAAKVTAASSGRLTAIEANLRNANSATGTIVLALYTDVSGSPGVELMRTTIANNATGSSLAYLKARSITCPDITSGTSYWIVGFVQDGGTGSYEISTTTAATTGKTSIDNGQTWSTTAFSFNVKLSTATAGGVKGCVRVKRPSGTSHTFISHGTSLYSVNETTAATTAVATDVSSAATYTRRAFVNDVLYWVDGNSKPHKYDFSIASTVTGAPENASNIIEHKGLLFYVSAADPSKVFYSNFGVYDTFTSTDFFYVPAPKTADPVKAMAKLLGNLYLITRNAKYILYGSENATFRLDSAVGQKGTFSQESIAYDQNHVYLASDDGIYKFNGAEEQNIALDVLDWWTSLSNKENTVLELHDNKLYIFFTPNGQSANTTCRVYNVLYNIWESEDTNTFVGRTYTRYDADNYFLQGSNRVGMLMLGERSTNDYTNMGEPFTYELRTNYSHYGTPAQYKRATHYRPHFDTVSGSYSVQMGYATDYSDSPTYSDLALQSTGPRFNTGVTFDSGATFGGLAQINPTDTAPIISGDWRRLQLRYKHYAAREPVSFDGHALALETQRMI